MAYVHRRASKRNFRVDGLTEGKRTLERLPQAIKDVVAETIGAGARIIEDEARARVPKRSRALLDSIGTNIRADGLQAVVGAGKYYAKFVEFGTRNTPAQPWLWPAFRIGARYIRRQMKEWAQEAGLRARTRTKATKFVRERGNAR